MVWFGKGMDQGWLGMVMLEVENGGFMMRERNHDRLANRGWDGLMKWGMGTGDGDGRVWAGMD